MIVMKQTTIGDRRKPGNVSSPMDVSALRAIFDQASDGIVVIDDFRTIIAMNPALERLTGYAAKDVVGQAGCRTILACQNASGDLLCDRACPGGEALESGITTPYQELFLKTIHGRSVPVSASFTPLELSPGGRRVFLMIVRDISNKRRQEQHLRRQALTDGLTGLFNHRSFLSHLKREVTRARRYHHPLSLLFMDLDFFKLYNDRRGHQKGDEALKRVARLLRTQMRGTDIAARYGGEEFVALLPETDAPEACVLAEQLRRSIERQLEESPTDAAGAHAGLTVSIGVAAFPADAASSGELLEQADRALYAAKLAGRNRVQRYQPDMRMGPPPQGDEP